MRSVSGIQEWLIYSVHKPFLSYQVSPYATQYTRTGSDNNESSEGVWKAFSGYICQVTYLDGLNEAQKDAVLSTEGPISVLAGAGSGKTRVLTTRVYHLIRKGVAPREILAVTFTNKAAREMSERVRAMLGVSDLNPSRNSSEVPFIATFHGLGRELLESYGRAIGVPRYFNVYDREDSERVIAAALKTLDVGAKELSPRLVLGRISRAKGRGLRAREFYEQERRGSYGARVAAEVWLRYDDVLKGEKALDFDDLIALPVRLLEEHSDVRSLAQDRWRYIHIDEYQDTNELQGRLAAILAEKHRNLFVVGDIDQTIYTWRGATIENLLDFDRTYPDARTIVLEHNYRSTKNLVDAANEVIEKNQKRKAKYATTTNPRGEAIVVHRAVNAEDEARWIAAKIRYYMREGERPEDIAILFRTNFQSRALEEGLLRAGVPYKLLGTHFFSRKEVKDVLAWVRLALDPSRDVDKIRAVASPPRGIGKVTLGKLVAGQRIALRPGERVKVEAFEQVIDELSSAVHTLLPSEFVRLVVEKSGLRTHLAEGSEDDHERLENVEELASVAARHDNTPGKEGIAAFLADAALASDQDEMDMPTTRMGKGEGKKGVTLMTVHAAKGLEFTTVFVSGMEEGLFPHEDVGGSTRGEDRDEEEERRLFYVAMTRAKKRLILTFARVRKIYGNDYLSEPSSFFSDIDAARMVYDESDGEHIIEA